MSNKPANLCLSCNLAEWHKTANGRVFPDDEGKCRWKPAYIPTAEAWKWNMTGEGYNQPSPYWGWIGRNHPIVSCETYEAKS